MVPMRCASIAIGLANPSSSMKAKKEGKPPSFLFPAARPGDFLAIDQFERAAHATIFPAFFIAFRSKSPTLYL